MNLTKKQIEIIVGKTPKELKGKQMLIYTTLGYYQKYGANWSYVAGYVLYKNQYVLVVTVFGTIQ